ncbi:MAG: hypothetical protein RL653_976 [Pseudomonadota bacterium]|jgi:hypothetical protein
MRQVKAWTLGVVMLVLAGGRAEAGEAGPYSDELLDKIARTSFAEKDRVRGKKMLREYNRLAQAMVQYEKRGPELMQQYQALMARMESMQETQNAAFLVAWCAKVRRLLPAIQKLGSDKVSTMVALRSKRLELNRLDVPPASWSRFYPPIEIETLDQMIQDTRAKLGAVKGQTRELERLCSDFEDQF